MNYYEFSSGSFEPSEEDFFEALKKFFKASKIVETKPKMVRIFSIFIGV